MPQAQTSTDSSAKQRPEARRDGTSIPGKAVKATEKRPVTGKVLPKKADAKKKPGAAQQSAPSKATAKPGPQKGISTSQASESSRTKPPPKAPPSKGVATKPTPKPPDVVPSPKPREGGAAPFGSAVGALGSGKEQSAPKSSSKASKLDPKGAEARYGEGTRLEREGRYKEAMQAYHDAAENGNGPAQKKLGDIYGSGNAGVQADYETSLRWYRRAREQGQDVPMPFTYPGVRR